MKNRYFFLWSLLGAALLLLFWEAASRFTASALILPGPLPVLRRFYALVTEKSFLLSLWGSFCRVLFGLALSVPLGLGAGIAAGLNRRIGAMLRPLFIFIGAVPVMSVILIAFLWFGQGRTPVFTAFLMVFPVMASNVVEGIRSVDPALVELFDAYGLPLRSRLRSLYLPSIVPFALGGLRSSLSLCWKVVVAAEVLVQPLRALGTGMQNAKAQLETAELFAWTAGTVLAAAFSQFVLTLLIDFLKFPPVKSASHRERS